MPVPRYIDDGDFSKAKQFGAVEFNFPFSDRGDNVSWEAIVKYRQDQASYRPLSAMTKQRFELGDAYLVTEGKAVSIGNGLYEFHRTFSSVPVPRTEYSSIVYSIQFTSFGISYDPAVAPDAPTVVEVTRPFACNILYEYSLTPFEIIAAPKVSSLLGILYYFGGYGAIVPGSRVLAEDAMPEIYKGRIYVRKSISIKYPNWLTS